MPPIISSRLTMRSNLAIAPDSNPFQASQGLSALIRLMIQESQFENARGLPIYKGVIPSRLK